MNGKSPDIAAKKLTQLRIIFPYDLATHALTKPKQLLTSTLKYNSNNHCTPTLPFFLIWQTD
jgi:hypothetical protein